MCSATASFSCGTVECPDHGEDMPRILIVDDEKSIRGALRQVFEYEDHEVVTAEDGPEALEFFESFRPHVHVP